MFKTVDFVFVGMVLAVATATYVVKYGTEIEHNKLSRLEGEIKVQKEAIDILNANWSLLTNPARLQELSERYGGELELQDLQPGQVIAIEQIPRKPFLRPGEGMDDGGLEDADAGISRIITGSIKSGRDSQ